MKSVYYYLLLLVIIIFPAGCQKFSLDQAPVSSVTDENFWKTSEQFDTFINGIHTRLRGHAYNFLVLGSMRSDEFGDTPFGGTTTNGNEVFWFNTLNSENPGMTAFGGFYTNINQLNLFIAKTTPTDLLPASAKNYFLGQAYGLRAFYYFHLLRAWGDVVVTTDPTFSVDISNLSKPASPAADVMKQIKKDIDSSSTRFGTDYSFKASDKAFWSKSATQMLKAEVYLWTAKDMKATTDAGIAKAALTDIQASVPALGLLPGYKDVFAYTNKNNKEIIFAIRYRVGEVALWNGDIATFLPGLGINNWYDSIANAKIDNTVENYTNPSAAVALFKPVSKKTFWSFSNADSRKAVSVKGAYNQVSAQPVQYTLAGAYLYKYQGFRDGGVRQLMDDYSIYRYADLLLMLAEAKSMLGENPNVEINLIRQRAYGANYQPSIHAYPNQPIDNNTDEALLQERYLEFVGEGKRWYDLRRFGKNYVFKYTSAKNDFQLLFPIDKSSLINNPSLRQNTGY